MLVREKKKGGKKEIDHSNQAKLFPLVKVAKERSEKKKEEVRKKQCWNETQRKASLSERGRSPKSLKGKNVNISSD